MASAAAPAAAGCSWRSTTASSLTCFFFSSRRRHTRWLNVTGFRRVLFRSLHDFGKVGVREQVLVKAKKLHPAELDRIRQRAELVKRGLELRYARRKIEYLLEK